MERKLETRDFNISALEIRGEGKTLSLVGYAAVFDSLSLDLGGFKEIVRRGAFAKTIQTEDIRALWNHNPDSVLGRKKNNTLRLSEDDKGLRIEIDLPDTQFAKDCAESVRRGDVDQMSFSFRTISDRWFKEDGEDRRELLEVALREVSPVAFPAYTASSIAALRSAGVDFDALSEAISRVERAGVEARSEDLKLIESASVFLSKINGNAKREEPNLCADFHARIKRKLALLELE